MLLLTSTSDLIQVVTSATSGSAYGVEVHASWLDNVAGAITFGRTNTAAITTAATTTVVGSPGASTQRNVRFLSIRNDHATDSCTVEVRHTDGTTVITLWKGTLLAGESVVFDGEGNWCRLSAQGTIVMSYISISVGGAPPASGLIRFGNGGVSQNLVTIPDQNGNARNIVVFDPAAGSGNVGSAKFGDQASNVQLKGEIGAVLANTSFGINVGGTQRLGFTTTLGTFAVPVEIAPSGTAPSSGLVRISLASGSQNVIVVQDPVAAAARVVAAFDTASGGTFSAFDANCVTTMYGLTVNQIATSLTSVYTGGVLRQVVDTAAIQSALPRLGYLATYASEGRVTIATAPAYTLTSAQYSRKKIVCSSNTTGTFTWPHPASEDASYFKIVENTGSTAVHTHSTGTGTTVALSTGQKKALLEFTPSGVAVMFSSP